MHQLTLRGFDELLERKIRQLSRAEGLSLNKAALALMRRGAGLETSNRGSDEIGDALDRFIGSWSRDDERALLESVAVFEQVDERFWS